MLQVRAFLKTLDTEIDIDQLPWATPAAAAASAAHPSSCSPATLPVIPTNALPSSPLFQQPAEQQQEAGAMQSEGPCLVNCPSRLAISNTSHIAGAVQQVPSSPCPSSWSGGDGSGESTHEHSVDSPLPPAGGYVGAPALDYSPCYPDRDWPEWAAATSPPKAWRRKCIEEWPRWAGDMSPPKEWGSDRIIPAIGVQPKQLVYQFDTCNQEAWKSEEICHCQECKAAAARNKSAAAASPTYPTASVAPPVAPLPSSLGLSCGHCTAHSTCDLDGVGLISTPDTKQRFPGLPSLADLEIACCTLHLTLTHVVPLPLSLGLSCGNCTAHSFACDLSLDGVDLNSMSDNEQQIPSLPSLSDLEIACCTLHLAPAHMVPLPSSLRLSGGHCTARSFTCEWGVDGVSLISMSHTEQLFPGLPSLSGLDIACYTLHLKPTHLVEG